MGFINCILDIIYCVKQIFNVIFFCRVATETNWIDVGQGCISYYNCITDKFTSCCSNCCSSSTAGDQPTVELAGGHNTDSEAGHV